ncbi:MAG: hypothetical protein LBQ30_01925 [Treponema sp.]|jgi:hypothetical protein|nr:hypothetical protein [Treponema sp.]
MQENICIPEGLILVFLVLPALRPYSRALGSLQGLVWFPLLALGMAIGLFPAYGFRLECIPLLIGTALLNIPSIPQVLAGLGRQIDEGINWQGFTLVCMILLIPSAAFALYFSPRVDTRLSLQGVTSRTIRDEARDAELFLRLYAPSSPDVPGSPPRPLMLLVPPVFGSVGMVDKVCGKLRDHGFTVLSFSRRFFDCPAWGTEGTQYNLPLWDQFRILQALIQGNSLEKANAWGKTLEAGRKEDILFLLSYIKRDLQADFPEAAVDLNTLFVAGYEAGGSALALLGASPEWCAANPAIKGLIVVESPLWSMYQAASDADPAARKSKKLHGLGPVSRPRLPILFMTSDRVSDPQERERRYGPLLKILQTDAPVVLAAVDGAGPLDYSDCPASYPLYSALFPGNNRTSWKYGTFIEGTASIMTNFASLLLETAALERSPGGQPAISRRKGLGGTVHFETGGAWNLPDFGYILSP